MATVGDNDSGADEPIVLLDDAEYLALKALPAGLDAAAVAYLRGQGINDPATWAAFKLGSIDEATYERLGLTGRRRPRGVGVSIPTWLPGDPARTVGVIRLSPAQNKHGFVTAPIGIAGPVDLETSPRVVLAITPWLALRLHSAGARSVALIEDIAVLPSLVGWLATREVLIVGHRRADIEAVHAALGPRTVPARGFVASMAPGAFSSEVRDALGLSDPVVQPPLPITAGLLNDLCVFARGRVEAGEAGSALASLGMDIPDLVAAYQIGYLPSDYRLALPREAQRSLAGHRCGNALLIPSQDEQGNVVDALVLRLPSPHIVASFWPEPRGIVGLMAVRGHADLIVTDSISWLARLFRQGHRNVWLVRSVDEARTNAPGLLASGVERITVRARRQVDELAAAFQSAGLIVTIERTPVEDGAAVAGADAPNVLAMPGVLPTVPQTLPSPTSTPRPDPVSPPGPVAPAVAPTGDVNGLAFVEEDRVSEVAIFQAGPIRFAVEMRDDGETRRQVVIRCGGQTCQDRFDLAHDAQRQRFAGNAARRLGQNAALISTQLAAVLSAVQDREEAHEKGPAVAVNDDERKAGLALLDAPNLLDLVAADLAAMGWIGEDKAKRVLYLASISRLLPQPVWAVYQASAGASPWQGVGCISALAPPESRTVFHRLTDAALTHTDKESLRHRLLTVDQAETLRPEAALALRVLHERGGVGWANATPGAASTGEVRGPVAVLAAAAGDIDHRCRDAFLTVTVDESPGQTAAILADQRRRVAAGGAPTPGVGIIIARHNAAQRLLERLPVRVPFADRIIFPASRLRHRDEQAWFLGLVAASALLHQRQRPREDGAVLATEADFALVVRATVGLLGVDAESISAAARRLLMTLYERKLAVFTMKELGSIFPDWTRSAFRAALQDLLDFGHVESPEGGRGRLREFRLVVREGGGALPGGIRLRASAAPALGNAEMDGIPRVGELAKVGEPDVANFIPWQTGT
jgi:hypothetical protein